MCVHNSNFICQVTYIVRKISLKFVLEKCSSIYTHQAQQHCIKKRHTHVIQYSHKHNSHTKWRKTSGWLRGIRHGATDLVETIQEALKESVNFTSLSHYGNLWEWLVYVVCVGDEVKLSWQLTVMSLVLSMQELLLRCQKPHVDYELCLFAWMRLKINSKLGE